MSEEQGKKETINIKVRSQRGEEVHFKLKPHTKMDKVINAFCQKVDVDPSTIRLVFDGRRVEPSQTAADLSLEDQDILDVLEHQVGGSF